MSQAQQPEDLIAELRKYSPHDPGNWPCQAAADEIERQRARIAELEAQRVTLPEDVLQVFFYTLRAKHPETTAAFSAFNWFTAGATLAQLGSRVDPQAQEGQGDAVQQAVHWARSVEPHIPTEQGEG